MQVSVITCTINEINNGQTPLLFAYIIYCACDHRNLHFFHYWKYKEYSPVWCMSYCMCNQRCELTCINRFSIILDTYIMRGSKICLKMLKFIFSDRYRWEIVFTVIFQWRMTFFFAKINSFVRPLEWYFREVEDSKFSAESQIYALYFWKNVLNLSPTITAPPWHHPSNKIQWIQSMSEGFHFIFGKQSIFFFLHQISHMYSTCVVKPIHLPTLL